jgi:hypothetical protein
MVPRSIQRQLKRLRRRERLLRLTWAAARAVSVFAVVLAAACLIDFTIDLYRDTPPWLRWGLFIGQIVVWVAGGAFVLVQLARRLSDNELSLWIEDKLPQLGHRLISAVQLNRPGADTKGMSPAMIAAVTRQAEEQVAAADFASIADARRLKWTVQLLAPLLLVVGLLFILWPQTVQALLARQLLDDRPIPRSLTIESARAQQVWPANEEGVLRFRVRGAFAEHLRGEVRLDLPDGDSARHELIFESSDDQGAIFLARVPPLTRDFNYRAWLKDGRTHELAGVHFEPRPIVRRQQAWVQLPPTIGLRPNGKAYEEAQKGSDVVFRLAGSSARIAIETQKPIVKAKVEVLGPPLLNEFATSNRHRQMPGQAPNLAVGLPVRRASEVVRRSVELEVGGDGCTAEGVFSFEPGIRPELLSTLAASMPVGGPASLPWASLFLVIRGEPMQSETAYRIIVRDEFDLENNDKPRRSIRTAPVDPPEVALLPEALPSRNGQVSEDDEIEGIPILLGQRVPLAYECKATYGLSHARLRYRVIPRTASREDEGDPGESEFLPLPLGSRRGPSGRAFREREFFTIPSDDPDRLGDIEGGGRYDFDSSGIPDGKGGLLRLQEGDRIQFYVEVFGRADPDGVPGRSTIREKEVVNQRDFWAWIEKKEDHKERIRRLEEEQRGLAGIVSLLPEDRPRIPDRTNPISPSNPPPAHLQQGDGVLGRDWQLIGPFADDNDTGHTRVYPPETETTDLLKQYDGINGKIRWQIYHGLTDKIDLQKFFTHGEAGVAYAACWIRSAGSQRVVLATGSDDGIKVWIDHKLVLDKAVHREAIPADDKTPITLRDGWQEVLVKVDNRFGSWAFYFDIVDPNTGKSLPPQRLQVRTSPLTQFEGKAFVKNWLLLGPFAAKENQTHSKEFPPERDPFDLKKEYDARKGKVRWKEFRSKEGRINLIEAFSLKGEEARNAAAYAVCWVKCDKEKMAILATGSDDGIKVWINRGMVHDKAVARSAEPSSDRTPVRLKAGWNEVLVKIDNQTADWAFYFELLDPPTGKALPGVEYRLQPPEKDKKK